MDRQTLRDRVRRATAWCASGGSAAGCFARAADLRSARDRQEAMVHGTPIEVWSMDEARVGQQGTLARLWAKRGTRPRAVRERRHARACLFGAACPARGTGAGVVLAWVEAMTIHLAEISRGVSEGAHAVLILDGAGWPTSPRPCVPENTGLPPLPRCAPDLNPGESVREFLRQTPLSHRVWDRCGASVDARCRTWTALIDRPEQGAVHHNPHPGTEQDLK